MSDKEDTEEDTKAKNLRTSDEDWLRFEMKMSECSNKNNVALYDKEHKGPYRVWVRNLNHDSPVIDAVMVGNYVYGLYSQIHGIFQRGLYRVEVLCPTADSANRIIQGTGLVEAGFEVYHEKNAKTLTDPEFNRVAVYDRKHKGYKVWIRKIMSGTRIKAINVGHNLWNRNYKGIMALYQRGPFMVEVVCKTIDEANQLILDKVSLTTHDYEVCRESELEPSHLSEDFAKRLCI